MKENIITIGIDASRAFVDDPAGPEYYSWHTIESLAKLDPSTLSTIAQGRTEFNRSATLVVRSGSQISVRYILYLRPGQKPNFALPQNFEIKNIGMRYLWTQVWLAIELLRDKPDILFIPAHTLPLISKVLLPQMPIVVTIHGLEGKFLPQSGSFLAHIYRNWSIGWAVRFATRLIAVSNDTRTDIVNTYHITSKDIQVIHEGVDVEKYKFSGEVGHKGVGYKTRKPSCGRYLLFVGTIQPRKNLVRLIKAFSLLKDKQVNLVLAGKYGWLYENILSSPKRFGVSDRVIFTGRVDDRTLVELYRGAQAFVLPSITEGFGLPILEAQASGLPIVSSYGGALREVAGEGALFINPLKTKEIAAALEKVLQSPKLSQELVKKGYQNVAKFSWDKSAYNTLKYLLDSLN